MTNFKNLLNIKPIVKNNYKNTLKVWIKMNSNNVDYIEHTEMMDANKLFSNKKLIYCLAYITAYKCADKDISKMRYRNDIIFGRYVLKNKNINVLYDILSDNHFIIYSDLEECHSYRNLEITYYDENSIEFNITFDDIHKQFETMTHDEICEMINNIK